MAKTSWVLSIFRFVDDFYHDGWNLPRMMHDGGDGSGDGGDCCRRSILFDEREREK